MAPPGGLNLNLTAPGERWRSKFTPTRRLMARSSLIGAFVRFLEGISIIFTIAVAILDSWKSMLIGGLIQLLVCLSQL